MNIFQIYQPMWCKSGRFSGNAVTSQGRYASTMTSAKNLPSLRNGFIIRGPTLLY